MTVMVMIGPLFLYVDNQPVAGRFLMLACICAMLGLLCLQITCVWCKERVEVPERPQGEKLNYLHVLKDVYKRQLMHQVTVQPRAACCCLIHRIK